MDKTRKLKVLRKQRYKQFIYIIIKHSKKLFYRCESKAQELFKPTNKTQFFLNKLFIKKYLYKNYTSIKVYILFQICSV